MVRKRPARRRTDGVRRRPAPAGLFCPADRPERFEKAAAAADVVILDLEDGVAAKDREAARKALIETPLDPDSHRRADQPERHRRPSTRPRRRWRAPTYTTVMLAKTEAPQQVRDLAPRDVVVLIETPLGALAVNELARMDNALAVMWGAEDLFAVLGRHRQPVRPDGSYREVARHVRSQTPAGRQGVRADGAGFGVPRHQGPRRPARRSRRRGGRRASTPRSPSTRPRWRSFAPAMRPPPSRWNGRGPCSRGWPASGGVFQHEGLMVDWLRCCGAREQDRRLFLFFAEAGTAVHDVPMSGRQESLDSINHTLALGDAAERKPVDVRPAGRGRRRGPRRSRRTCLLRTLIDAGPIPMGGLARVAHGHGDGRSTGECTGRGGPGHQAAGSSGWARVAGRRNDRRTSASQGRCKACADATWSVRFRAGLAADLNEFDRLRRGSSPTPPRHRSKTSARLRLQLSDTRDSGLSCCP